MPALSGYEECASVTGLFLHGILDGMPKAKRLLRTAATRAGGMPLRGESWCPWPDLNQHVVANNRF
jgi:hypothetical protein